MPASPLLKTAPGPAQALEIWRRAALACARGPAPDLSARQSAVLLTVYLTPPPHTVRGLAHALAAPKPAMTRALDRLAGLGLVRRRPDAADRRGVIIRRTAKGAALLNTLGGNIADGA
ncbi:MAG: MarR family transcriptional regulator [Rhodospirillales bacterium]